MNISVAVILAACCYGYGCECNEFLFLSVFAEVLLCVVVVVI